MSVYVKSVHSLDAKCVKLKMKHDSYASFKIEVMCNNVSKFFNPKTGQLGSIYLDKYIRRTGYTYIFLQYY